MLTLKDPQSSKTLVVPPEGAILGREGGTADIVVRSTSVSKRHARLFPSNGTWWLKDLGSANGTFVGKERIQKAVEVTPGLVFLLSSYRLEVASISQPSPEPEGRTVPGMSPLRPEPTVVSPKAATGTPALGARPAAARPTEPAPDLLHEVEPDPPREETARHPDEEDRLDETMPPQEELQPLEGTSGLNAAGAQAGFQTALAQLPKAIAHYTVTVPKLLFNPMGTIRQSIDDQRFPAMRGWPLLGWALPGLAISAAVGLICSFIVVLITAIRGGGFAFGSLVGDIIKAALVGVLGGLFVAFLFHPVFEFIINRLFKGNSDEKSRTNYLIISQSAVILAAVPSGLTVLVVAFASLIPVASIVALAPIVPSLISLGATLITVLLAYHWFKFFQVHRAVPTVILVLGLLAVLGTLWGVIGSVRFAIAAIGSGSPHAVVDTSGKDLSADIQRAQAEAKKAQAEVATGAAAAPKVAAAEPAKPVAAAARTPDPTPEPAARIPPPEPAKAEEPPARAEAAPAASFQAYAQRHESVEKTIAADPTLLLHDGRLLGLYKKLHAIERDIRKSRGGRAGIPADDLVSLRLVEAETFEKTNKLVDELYQRLPHP